MNHPITPPPELRSQWFNETPRADIYDYIIEKAAQWGADQELELCCEWLKSNDYDGIDLDLRAARRPKAPSLKQQALEALDDAPMNVDYPSFLTVLKPEQHALIRRALEAMPDD